MINREKQLVNLVSYTSGYDEYGKPLNTIQETKEIQMMITLYKESNVNDVRFIDATHLGITSEKGITDKNYIILGADEYKVIQVIPSKRYTQVFLKKVL